MKELPGRLGKVALATLIAAGALTGCGTDNAQTKAPPREKENKKPSTPPMIKDNLPEDTKPTPTPDQQEAQEVVKQYVESNNNVNSILLSKLSANQSNKNIDKTNKISDLNKEESKHQTKRTQSSLTTPKTTSSDNPTQTTDTHKRSKVILVKKDNNSNQYNLAIKKSDLDKIQSITLPTGDEIPIDKNKLGNTIKVDKPDGANHNKDNSNQNNIKDIPKDNQKDSQDEEYVVFKTPYQIEVNKTTNKLYLYKKGKLIKKYSVATGADEKDNRTPEGTFPIVTKTKQPQWRNIKGGDPKNPLGPRWHGLKVGDKGRSAQGQIYGIHGTIKKSSIGRHSTNGCIRMYNEDVKELYDIVPSGTPVWIHSGKSNGKWQGSKKYYQVKKSSKKAKKTDQNQQYTPKAKTSTQQLNQQSTEYTPKQEHIEQKKQLSQLIQKKIQQTLEQNISKPMQKEQNIKQNISKSTQQKGKYTKSIVNQKKKVRLAGYHKVSKSKKDMKIKHKLSKFKKTKIKVGFDKKKGKFVKKTYVKKVV
ncbi:L,D-transpeptidase [Thermoflavimicrobium daqui]|uniref:L,D-TPase catalytic domain-containing protein n=1 Tax=Thermoflavimicrobium daqui TaxID=2137476 RepID=A0A364K1V1_9BACL|nr:L,D-transpeptidase [Thermoflavimicrobium daqui]RAL21935.1 hypothetical protein DL897_15200 [Thermoflavimicrobium daqui]